MGTPSWCVCVCVCRKNNSYLHSFRYSKSKTKNTHASCILLYIPLTQVSRETDNLLMELPGQLKHTSNTDVGRYKHTHTHTVYQNTLHIHYTTRPY